MIDKILVDAASAAGAEVREGFTVEDVIVEEGSSSESVGTMRAACRWSSGRAW